MTVFCWGIPALLVGIVVAREGRRGYRVGQDPHCNKCNYNCRGIVARCPECGVVLTEETLVTGALRRQPVFHGVGIALVLLGAAASGRAGFSWCKNHDWWQHAPLTWVIDGIAADRAGAIQELHIRYACNQLTPEMDLDADSHTRLVEALLTVQKQGARATGLNGPRVPDWGAQKGSLLSLLHVFYLDGHLTPEQRETYLSQIAVARFAAREQVRQQDPLVVAFHLESWAHYDHPWERDGASELRMRSTSLVCRVGANVVHDESFVLPSYGGSASISVDQLSPGQHELVIQVAKAVYDRPLPCVCEEPAYDPETHGQIPTPIWEGSEEFRTTITILPKSAPDPLVVRADGTITKQLREALTKCEVLLQLAEAEEERPHRLSVACEWSRDRMPDVSNAVLSQLAAKLVVGTRELPLTSSSRLIAPDRYEVRFADRVAASELVDRGEVTLVLTNDVEAARESVDYYEVWGGVLRIGPMPLAITGN